MQKVRPLIGILGCHKLPEFRKACRDTWLGAWGKQVDYRFFIGEPKKRGRKDEVYLPCPDGYDDLPVKVYQMFKWALDHDYTHIFKCDDDTYVHIPRLLKSGFEQHDYVGLRVAYYYAAGGSGYWLSRETMRILTSVPESEWAKKKLEDATVGEYLVLDQRARLYYDRRYTHSDYRQPAPDNDFITGHKCNPERMRLIHDTFHV